MHSYLWFYKNIYKNTRTEKKCAIWVWRVNYPESFLASLQNSLEKRCVMEKLNGELQYKFSECCSDTK